VGGSGAADLEVELAEVAPMSQASDARGTVALEPSGQ